MLVGDHADLLGLQPDQRADRKEPDQVDEAAQQLLVERRVVLLAHDRLDAIARQPFAVDARAAERIVHVRDADDLRAQVQRSVPDVGRIAGQVLAQVVLDRAR